MKDCKDFASIVPTRYCGGCLLKIPSMGLVDKIGVNRWVLFKSTHYGPAGYWAGELFQNSQ